jgi:hypothetical protein
MCASDSHELLYSRTMHFPFTFSNEATYTFGLPVRLDIQVPHLYVYLHTLLYV